MNTTPTILDTLIQEGWAEHTQQPAPVADRLEAGLGLLEGAGQAARYRSLVTHVVGDHLGDRERARRLCESAAERVGEAAGTDGFVYLSVARRLAGDDKTAASALASRFEDAGLIAWFRQEHTKAL